MPPTVPTKRAEEWTGDDARYHLKFSFNSAVILLFGTQKYKNRKLYLYYHRDRRAGAGGGGGGGGGHVPPLPRPEYF